MTDAHQIIIAGVISGHIACKSIYTRIFAGTDRMHKRDFTAVGSWVGIAVALWVIAWIIAEAIPMFSNLLSLMVCFTYQSFKYLSIFWLWLIVIAKDGTLRQLVQFRSPGYVLVVYE